MIEPVLDTPAVFAECPVWLAGPQRLCWVDCAAGRLISLDWRTRAVACVLSLPGTLFCGLVRHGESGLLLLTGSGALVVDLHGRATPFPLPAAIDAGLVNDGKADRTGRLWVGQVRSTPDAADGALVCVSGGQAIAAVSGLGIPNGPAFSPDGGTLYFADSLYGTVDTLALHPSGALGDRRRLLALPPEAGRPDGMTVDADDHLIVAVFDGGALLRIDPATSTVTRIELPVRQPTSCAFGGPNLTTLFVTVANGPWPGDRRNPDPPAAADPGLPSLYAISMTVPGVPEPDVASRTGRQVAEVDA